MNEQQYNTTEEALEATINELSIEEKDNEEKEKNIETKESKETDEIEPIKKDVDNDNEIETEIETDENNEDTPEEQDDETEQEGDSKEITIPQNMPKDLAKRMEELKSHPDAQKAILSFFKKVEANLTRKSQKLASERHFAEEASRVFENNKLDQILKVVEDYRKFEDLLIKEPEKAITALAKSQKIDLSKLVTQNNDEEYLSDFELSQKKEIESLKQEIYSLKNSTEQQKKAEVEKIKQKVEEFRDAQDAEGNLLYPHFDKVRSLMGKLASERPESSLEDLYESAVLADKELRKEYLEKERLKETKIARAKSIQATKIKNKPEETTKNLTSRDLIGFEVDNFFKENNLSYNSL